MKTLLPLLAFACFALSTAGHAQILVDGFDGFETYPIGNLGTQGGWASVNVNGSSAITVTNSIAYQGVQSLSIFDGDSVSRPNARMDLGSNSAEGSFSVALHESADTTGNDLWRVDFFGTGSTTPHFSIATTSSNISLIGGANGTTSLLSVPLNTTSYSRTAWNTIEVTYNETSNTASIFLNGGSTPILTSNDASTNWSVGRFELSVGSGAATNQQVYFDAVAVPEPSTGAFLGASLLMGWIVTSLRRVRKVSA